MGQISIDGWEPPHVSFSTLNSYRMCGTKLYLEKVARKEQLPGLAAIGGNATHVATEHVDKFVLEHGFEALDCPVSSDVDTNISSLPDEPDF